MRLDHPASAFCCGATGTTLMQYDVVTGALSTITDKNGTVYHYRYDAAGRVHSRLSRGSRSDWSSDVCSSDLDSRMTRRMKRTSRRTCSGISGARPACASSARCPSCHAKRLAAWGLWLEETLLAPVPHRQVVLTIPKRLRAYCLFRRSLLVEIARVAARTVTAAIRVTSGERALSVGIIGCLQTHGSRANWHPHIHMIVTDGGFRSDGTFVHWPTHDSERLPAAFRRAVLRLFVRKDLFEAEQAEAMLAWPHSGFHVHDCM